MTKGTKPSQAQSIKSKANPSQRGRVTSIKLRKINKGKSRPILHTQLLTTQPSHNQHQPQPTTTNPRVQSQIKQTEDQMKPFFHDSNRLILAKYGKDILENYIETEKARLISFSNYNETVSTLNGLDYKKLHDTFDKAIQNFKLSEETFFLSSYIVDSYLNAIKEDSTLTSLDSKEFKLIGLTAFFIATKVLNVPPLSLNHVRTIIGKNQYTSDELIEKEIDIVNRIDFDFQIISTYDMIQMMFSDCITYSIEKVNNLEIKESLNLLLNLSVLLSKMIESNKSFVNIKISLKAIGCIVSAYELFRSNAICTKGSKFITDWIIFLIQRNGYTNETLISITNRIKGDFSIQMNKHQKNTTTTV